MVAVSSFYRYNKHNYRVHKVTHTVQILPHYPWSEWCQGLEKDKSPIQLAISILHMKRWIRIFVVMIHTAVFFPDNTYTFKTHSQFAGRASFSVVKSNPISTIKGLSFSLLFFPFYFFFKADLLFFCYSCDLVIYSYIFLYFSLSRIIDISVFAKTSEPLF